MTNLGGQPLTHPLGESFYSQGPLRYGDYVAKVMVAPVSPNLAALKDTPFDLRGSPNGLRQAAIDALAHDGGEWEVRVQLAPTGTGCRSRTHLSSGRRTKALTVPYRYPSSRLWRPGLFARGRPGTAITPDIIPERSVLHCVPS